MYASYSIKHSLVEGLIIKFGIIILYRGEVGYIVGTLLNIYNVMYKSTILDYCGFEVMILY